MALNRFYEALITMYLEFNHLLDAYYEVVNLINEQGRDEITEDGEYTLTLDEPLTIKIKNPTTATLFPYGLGSKSALAYAHQMMYPTRDNDFEYTYGLRLRRYSSYDKAEVDQIENIINRLDENPNTRRAVASIYDPHLDYNGSKIPCMNHVQFRVVDGKLDCYVLFRSQDMLSAWFLNCYGLTSLMNYVRGGVKGWYERGCLIITANCPHIYPKRDKDVLDRVLKEREIRQR